MKSLILANLLLLIFAASFGQPPKIISNDKFVEGHTSEFFFVMRNKYDFVIAYQEDGYWGANNIDYQILAMKDGKWYYILKRQNNKKGFKSRVTTKEINSELGNDLLNKLSQISFWSLSSDSLNIKTKKIDDSTSVHFSVTDGIIYRFDVFTKHEYRVIHAYMPDFYLEKMPEIKSRQTFIDARKIFKDLIKEIST